ncbi:MAG: hypothetical protein H0W33_03590 [Gammaproteobacteria bacterium]|nr:hypothetical protein [Gammaproteobacteria bacterium]
MNGNGGLKDFRGKVTAETDAVLEAINRVTGRDRSEIAREVLHEWATEQIHVARVLDQRLRAEGLHAIGEGTSGSAGGARGNPRESQGR